VTALWNRTVGLKRASHQALKERGRVGVVQVVGEGPNIMTGLCIYRSGRFKCGSNT
jgi:hypothetical protein